MSASLRARQERAEYELVRRSTVALTDDTRVRLVVPLRVVPVVATATIAEIIAARLARTLVVN